MDEEALNTSTRKFLKKLGVAAQREIEKAVRDGVASGRLKGSERLPAKAVVTLGGVHLKFEIDGDIEVG
jgi:Family of unknown function (DUF6494)